MLSLASASSALPLSLHIYKSKQQCYNLWLLSCLDIVCDISTAIYRPLRLDAIAYRSACLISIKASVPPLLQVHAVTLNFYWTLLYHEECTRECIMMWFQHLTGHILFSFFSFFLRLNWTLVFFTVGVCGGVEHPLNIHLFSVLYALLFNSF